MATLVNKAKIIQRAEKLVKQGRLDAAIAEYEKLIQDNPSDWGIINIVGDLYARRGQFRLATEMFGQVADHYQREGLFLKAIAINKKMQKLSPVDLRLHEKLADLYLKQGLQLEARSHLLSLAKLHGESGDISKVLEVYRRLVDLDPDNTATRTRLAELYRKEGNPQQSFQEYLAIGQGYLARDLLEEASSALEQALELQPDNATVVSELSRLYMRRQQLRKAIALLEQQRRRRPEDVALALLRGDVYFQGDEVQEAEKCYLEALALDPRSSAAARSIGAFLLERGELDRYYQIIQPVIERLLQSHGAAEALALLQTLLDQDPNYVPALQCVIDVHATLGEEFERLDRMRALAEAQVHHGRLNEARELLRDLVELDPTNETHGVRLRQLTRMGAGLPEQEQELPEAPAGLTATPLDLVLTPYGATSAKARSAAEPAPPRHRAEEAEPFEFTPDVRTAAGALVDDSERITPPGLPFDEGGADPPAPPGTNEPFSLFDLTAPVTRLERAGGDEIELARNAIRENPTDIQIRKQLIDLYMQRSMEREAADEYLAISRVLAEFGEPELQEKYAQEASTIYARLARDEPGAADLPRVEPLGPEGHSPFFDDPVIFGDLELEAQLTDDVHQAARAAVEQSEVEPSDQDVASLYDLEIRESEFADPLRDVLFYVDNGFIAEAQDLLAELKRRYGQDGEIASRLDELEARTRLLAEAQGLTASAPSADLPVSEVEATDGNELSPEDQQVQDLFQEFQRSIHAQLGAQDYKTHYDLGLAYREMALFDEAIREFEIAVQDSQLYLEACSLLGLCWMDKGDPRGAIEWFERGLAGRGQADKAQGLLYYLGTAYEQAGDFEGAKSSFAKLLELDPNFRDVQKKARDLGL